MSNQEVFFSLALTISKSSHTVLMYLFILINLLIALLAQQQTQEGTALLADPLVYIGAFFVLGCFVLTSLKVRILSFRLRYDLFAVGALLIWYVYWPGFFVYDTPVFTVYPWYFVFISVLFSLFFVHRPEQIDSETLRWLQWLSDSGRFNPLFIMLLVILSLFFPEHFLLFPISITLWVMRYVLACCLGNE